MSYPHTGTDYTVHPGEVLDDILTSRGIDRHAFARRIEMLESTLEKIIDGRDIIYGSHLRRMASELNTPVELWENLYRNYFKAKTLQAESL